MTALSVVSPVFNEEASLEAFYKELSRSLEACGRSYEIVLVDDGSRDGSPAILERLATADSHVCVVSLARNFGQHAAIYAGIQHTRGDLVLIMDSDLQHDPAEIPLFLARMDEPQGWDLISGRRVGRKESFWIRRVPSAIANLLLRKATGCPVQDAGGYKCLRGPLARALRINKGQHRFLPALVYLQGGRIAEVDISAPERRFGKSHYGIGRSVDVFFDILLLWFQSAYLVHPLHLLGRVSLVLMMVGGGILSWLTYEKIFQGVAMGTRPLLILSVMSILIGLLALMMGFVAEMISAMHQGLSDTRLHTVAKVRRTGEAKAETPEKSWSRAR